MSLIKRSLKQNMSLNLDSFEPPKLLGLGLELREDPGVEKKELSLFTVK
jgi:hypothetical protein